jgi:hypothetical protein
MMAEYYDSLDVDRISIGRNCGISPRKFQLRPMRSIHNRENQVDARRTIKLEKML